MRVKTRIIFEVEYPLDLEFYGTDKEKALSMEKAYVAVNPMEMIEAYEARGAGTFTTNVEAVNVEHDKVKYCEFTGDDEMEWNAIGLSERNCEHLGFAHCLLHDKPIHEDSEGWRRCCPECVTPRQVKK